MTNMEQAKLVKEPTIFVLAEMALDPDALPQLLKWLEEFAPGCLDPREVELPPWDRIFPHSGRESSGIETRKVTDNELLVELSGRKCCDAETEVLTPDGWVKFPDLKPQSPVATYSLDRDRLEFQLPTDRIKKEFTGQMYTVESRALSLRITSDHELLVKRRAWNTSEPWAFLEAKSVAGSQYKIRRTAGVFEDGRYTDTDFVFNFVAEPSLEDWAEFLGYFISEGSIGGGKEYGTGEHIRIYQRPEGMGPIRACASLIFGDAVKTWRDPRNGVEAVVINRTELAQVLREQCGQGSWEKRIPRVAFSWPRSARSRLLDALMYGDGCEDEYGHRIYNTCNEGLADDVQRLMILNGSPSTISRLSHNQLAVREGSQGIVTVNNKAQHDRLESVEREMVYCVTVPNRTILVRRHGKTAVISNCYNSFGLKAGRRSNAEYVSNLFGEPGKIPHASVLYHAKMTFFFGGIGRRVSHELIRHYVGADRDEEGSPSQESTRFTHHSGHFSLHPRDAGDAEATEFFLNDMNEAYSRYHRYLKREVDNFKLKNGGAEPKGMDRKRIYEAAAQRLPGAACTSFTWTTNPMALAKLFEERCDYAADLEIQRFAKQLRVVCYKRWPNLFKASNPAYGKAAV